jgi:hypothetical protein
MQDIKHQLMEMNRVMEREASPHLRQATPFSSGDLTRAQKRKVQSEMNSLKKKLAMLKLKGARITAMVNKANAPV